MVQHIEDSNFAELLASNQLMLVDFSATWCGPCRMMAPIVERLAEKYEGRILIGKADVEEAVDLAERYGIRSIPTLLFFKNGELLEEPKFVGAVPEAKLAETIESLL